MATVAETKERVQRFLTQLATVNIDEQGRYSIRHESARVFVEVEDFGDGDTWVRLVSPLLYGVTLGPELYEYVALHSDDLKYGTLTVRKDPEDAGKGALFLGYGLLGTTLDPDELKLAVGMLVTSANRIDDELKVTFGGERFHEDGD